MYRNTFERAFSGVEPEISDEEFIYKIKNRDDSKKARKVPKRAVVIPITAAALALGTITASAAGGFDFLRNFSSYFSADNESGLDAAGAAESDNTYSFDDYTLKINGYIADSTCLYISYDITYKKEKYFRYKDTVVRSIFAEKPPVQFYLKSAAALGGYGKSVSLEGDTVRYVKCLGGNFESEPVDENGERKFDIYFQCYDDYFPQRGRPEDWECKTLGMFETSVRIPPAKERDVTIYKEITLSDGRKTVLEGALISPLSAKFRFSNDYYQDDMAYLDSELSIKTKDGRTVSFNLNKSVFAVSYTDELLEYFDNLKKAREQAAAEAADGGASTKTIYNNGWPYGDLDIPSEVHMSYNDVIDPDDVAEINILGENIVIE